MPFVLPRLPPPLQPAGKVAAYRRLGEIALFAVPTIRERRSTTSPIVNTTSSSSTRWYKFNFLCRRSAGRKTILTGFAGGQLPHPPAQSRRSRVVYYDPLSNRCLVIPSHSPVMNGRDLSATSPNFQRPSTRCVRFRDLRPTAPDPHRSYPRTARPDLHLLGKGRSGWDAFNTPPIVRSHTDAPSVVCPGVYAMTASRCQWQCFRLLHLLQPRR